CASTPFGYIMNPYISTALNLQFSACSKTYIAAEVASDVCLSTIGGGTATPSPTPTPVPPSAPCGAVTWANAVNVTAPGNSLQKTAGGAAWNAGAASSTQLNAGDGAVQLQVDGVVGYRIFGLSNGDPDQNYTSIKYALYPMDGGALYVLESGVSLGQF